MAHKPTVAQLQGVARLLSRIADQADQIPARQVPRMLALVGDAVRESRAALKAWVRSVPEGAARYTAQHHRLAIIQLEKVRSVLGKKLPAAMAAELVRGQTGMATEALTALESEVALFSEVFAGQAVPINLRKAAIIAEGETLILSRAKTSAARYGNQMLGYKVSKSGRLLSKLGWTERIQVELSKGLLQRESFNQITERLVRIGGPKIAVSAEVQGLSAIEVVPEGIFKLSRHRAEAVVRTELMNSFNATKRQGLEDLNKIDPGWLLRWDATADGRVCPTCRFMDGKVIETDESFQIMLRVERASGEVAIIGATTRLHPPVHPNDRCAVTPWRIEWGTSASVTRTIDDELAG